MSDWQLPLMAGEMIKPNSLKDIIDSGQERERLQTQNALKQIFSDPQAMDANTGQVSPNTIRQLLQVDPGTALKLQQEQTQAHQQKNLVDSQIQQHQAMANKYTQQTDLAQAEDAINYIGVPAAKVYEDALKGGLPKEQAQKLAQQEYSKLREEYSTQGHPPSIIDRVDANFDMNRFLTNKTYLDSKKEERLEQEANLKYSNIQPDGLGGMIGFNKSAGVVESLPMSEGAHSKKTSEKDSDYSNIQSDGKGGMIGFNKKTGTIQSIPMEEGAQSKLSGTGAMGSRESVFTQRVILSGNEAVKDLRNIAKLPITVSTGIFGGREQGKGLFDATKEALANKVTDRDVQLYNVMATGFQRSLSAIESAGLAPSGTLSHQMESVLLKEGDDYLTKASKLAQIRQIIEAGLEPALENPRVSASEKAKIQKIIDESKKAVPFTQDDVIKLVTSDNKNQTLSDYMDKNKSKEQKSSSEGKQVKSQLGKITYPEGSSSGASGFDNPERIQSNISQIDKELSKKNLNATQRNGLENEKKELQSKLSGSAPTSGWGIRRLD